MHACIYVMLCYVMLCYVMLCYAMLCYGMLCCTMLCPAVLCCTELTRTRSLHGGRIKQELTRMRSLQGGQSMQELSRTRFPQGGQTTQVLSRTIYSTSPKLAVRRQDTALSMSADKLPSLRPCSAEAQHGVTGEPARRPRRVSLNSPYHSSTGLKHTHLDLCHIRTQKHDCDA